MCTLLPDPPPAELREALGELPQTPAQWGDHHDEVWDGVLHVNPVSNWRHAALQTQVAVLLSPLALGPAELARSIEWPPDQSPESG